MDKEKIQEQLTAIEQQFDTIKNQLFIAKGEIQDKENAIEELMKQLHQLQGKYAVLSDPALTIDVEPTLKKKEKK